MRHLRVLSMLVCLTRVLFMVFSPKKICFSSIKFAHRLTDTTVYYICFCFYVETLNLYQVQSDITQDEILYLHVEASSYFIKT